MDFYLEKTPVVFDIPLTNLYGHTRSPLTIEVIISDGNGVVIDTRNTEFSDSVEALSIEVHSNENEIPAGHDYAARIVDVTVGFPSGSVNHRFSYILERQVVLSLLENTFVSYENAFILSRDFAKNTNWLSADDNMRKSALKEAFFRIIKIPMRYHPLDENGVVDEKVENILSRNNWENVSVEDFQALPERFRQALMRAQFVEARNLLRLDAYAEKRAQGVISESIAESSVRLSENALRYGVGDEALEELTGFIHFDFRIGRA